VVLAYAYIYVISNINISGELEKYLLGWEIIKAKNTIDKLINLTCQKFTISHVKIVVFTFLWQKLPHIAFTVKAWRSRGVPW
jgi:hypothetical protein